MTSKPEDKPWGLREFGLRTPDGHRITCGAMIQLGARLKAVGQTDGSFRRTVRDRRRLFVGRTTHGRRPHHRNLPVARRRCALYEQAGLETDGARNVLGPATAAAVVRFRVNPSGESENAERSRK